MLEGELARPRRRLIEDVAVDDGGPLVAPPCPRWNRVEQPPQLRQHHCPGCVDAASSKLETKPEQPFRILCREHQVPSRRQTWRHLA